MADLTDLLGLTPGEETDAVYLLARHGGDVQDQLAGLIDNAVRDGDAQTAKHLARVERHLSDCIPAISAVA